ARLDEVSGHFEVVPRAAPPPPVKPRRLLVHVTLSNGASHRIPIAEEDPKRAALRLTTCSPPFAADWIEADDGSLIRSSSIVSARVSRLAMRARAYPAQGLTPLSHRSTPRLCM